VWSDRTEFSVNAPATWDPFVYNRRASFPPRSTCRATTEIARRRGRRGTDPRRNSTDKAALLAHKFDRLGDFTPDFILEPETVVEVDPRDEKAIAAIHAADESHLVTVCDGIDLPVITAFRLLAARLESRHPILLKDTLAPVPSGTDVSAENSAFLDHLLTAATHLGALLCDGIGDAILVQGKKRPDSPCGWLLIRCRRRVAGSSRPTTSRAQVVAARFSISKKPPLGSKPLPFISRASRSRSWDVS
jgi:(E)-4-hydroxy-3-methylbut-2-enyl-diphosphate synthase